MIVSGIVAEFNPFHNGHKYLLEQAEGIKIVVMSGNFMQRGEPAIIDKWTRAKMALENGADIVVEMPFLVSVQAADYFAKGAIDILNQLGVNQLVFGTESVMDYDKIVDVYKMQQSEMEDFINQLPDDLSYPEKTQKMWKTFTGIEFSGDSPNHILALAYAKAVSETKIKMIPILRQGSGFHSKEKETRYASATAIRAYIDDKKFVENSSPSAALLQETPHVSWDDYFDFLKYQIITHPNLNQIYQVNEELASRISSNIRTVSSFDELVKKVSTKRYTKARVRRIMTYILVNACEDTLPTGIHLLGFSKNGREHLKQYKKSVQLVSKIASSAWDSITQTADQVYQLGHPLIEEQTYGRIPIIKND